MADPSTVEFRERLGHSYALDLLWREMMGLAGDTKEQPLRAVITVLEATGTSYALIGGVAMQLYSQEPRTTLDIDLAVVAFDKIPVAALKSAGFTHEGRQEHSDNWRAPGTEPRRQRIAVQFSSEDVGIEAAVAGARTIDVGGFQLRVAAPPDLLVLKLAAAEEPRRRPGKRRQDLLDIITLSEEHPEAAQSVPELSLRVARLNAELFILGTMPTP
jgi:hypothetical protein